MDKFLNREKGVRAQVLILKTGDVPPEGCAKHGSCSPAGVRESPEAGKCLANFVQVVVLLLVGFLAGIPGCSSGQKSEVLVNPITGRLVRCDLLKGDMAAKCVDVAQKRGYVPPDKLTAEQRARFKSQGAVSVETLTPQEQRVLDQRGVLPPDAIPSIP